MYIIKANSPFKRNCFLKMICSPKVNCQVQVRIFFGFTSDFDIVAFPPDKQKKTQSVIFCLLNILLNLTVEDLNILYIRTVGSVIFFFFFLDKSELCAEMNALIRVSAVRTNQNAQFP